MTRDQKIKKYYIQTTKIIKHCLGVYSGTSANIIINRIQDGLKQYGIEDASIEMEIDHYNSFEDMVMLIKVNKTDEEIDAEITAMESYKVIQEKKELEIYEKVKAKLEKNKCTS